MTAKSDYLTLQDFHRCCRLCFEGETHLEDLFAASSQASSSNLLSKIAECLDVSITPEDYPGTLICLRCATLVEQFYDYKKLCKLYDCTFRTSIKNGSSNISGSAAPAEAIPDNSMVWIKTEAEEAVEQEEEPQIEEFSSEWVKQEPDNSCSETFQVEELRPPAAVSLKSFSYSRDVTVRMIFNRCRMNCTKINMRGIMHWTCSSRVCDVTVLLNFNGEITLPSMVKTHSHDPHVDRVGRIRHTRSGLVERFATDPMAANGEVKMTWRGHEWLVEPANRTGERKAFCTGDNGKCPKHLRVFGDFQEIEDFAEHSHQPSFIMIREELQMSENDINPWDLFTQINPCRLPLSSDSDVNRKLKFFHDRHQYHLKDCFWNGNSRWICESLACNVLITYTASGNVHVGKHKHPPVTHGLFNGLYYNVVTTTNNGRKLYYNGYSYGRRGDADNWVCTATGCHGKLYVGENLKTFAEKGKHSHEMLHSIIKPMRKPAINITKESPTLPNSITIGDLEGKPLTTAETIEVKPPIPPKPPKKQQQLDDQPKVPRPAAKRQTRDDESFIRMVLGDFRYTLWEIFPDGTSYWRCWGKGCRKSLHMNPAGSLYIKNEGSEHVHGPTVSSVGQVTATDTGQVERYAIYDDMGSHTILVFRNTRWDLVQGEGSHVATCKESGCEAKIKISFDFTHLTFAEKCNHPERLFLIRASLEPVEGDPIIWQLFLQKYPLRLVDGSIYTEGRHSHLFFGGFRYTLQSLQWSGSSLWRCAVQLCTAKGRLEDPDAKFQVNEHKHDKPEILNGKMWSVKRQRNDPYIVSASLKKTQASLYYNTYSYILKDQQRNVWGCYPSLCNATLRVEGDFERVVEEVEHNHDGTLVFIRSDGPEEVQECYAPAKASSRKRPLPEEYRASAEEDPPKPFHSQSTPSSSATAVAPSPKLDQILQTLVKRSEVVKPSESKAGKEILHYYEGYTYCIAPAQLNRNTRLDCSRCRCMGRTVMDPDQNVLSRIPHNHPKSFETYSVIRDVLSNQYYPFILVSGTRKGYTDFFVCDGYRYRPVTKISEFDTDTEWQCIKCDVKVTLSDSFSTIEYDSDHNHDRTDFIIASKEGYGVGMDQEDATNQPMNDGQLEEVIWGENRYITPVFLRRINKNKWVCCNRPECKGCLYQSLDGSFEDIESHNHRGTVEQCGEARYDETLKVKDRFAILKDCGRFKSRVIVFQNYKYTEIPASNYWHCVKSRCKAKLLVDTNYNMLLREGEHIHRPILTAIKFFDEIQCCSIPPLAKTEQ